VRRAAGLRRALWAGAAYWLNPAVLMTTTLGYVDVAVAIPAVGRGSGGGCVVRAAAAGRSALCRRSPDKTSVCFGLNLYLTLGTKGDGPAEAALTVAGIDSTVWACRRELRRAGVVCADVCARSETRVGDQARDAVA